MISTAGRLSLLALLGLAPAATAFAQDWDMPPPKVVVADVVSRQQIGRAHV